MYIREAKIVYGRRKFKSEVFNRPEHVYDYFKFMSDFVEERVYVACLNNANVLISFKEVSVGTINASVVIPRDIFRLAVMVGASSIILIHNHPSGGVTPSTQDIEITKVVKEAGRILGIKVLDHIIIGFNEFYSLNEMGLLDSE